MNDSTAAGPPPTREQFEGSLLGAAVGDALAAPWEGIPADLIYQNGPAERIVAEPGRRMLRYTDDTQMTVGVIETLIAHGRIDVLHLAGRFAANYHPDRGYGQGARRIINAIGAGEDWETLAETLFNGEGSLGNGAAMRSAPIGLFFSESLETVAEQADLSAAPTHRHPIGIDGARLMAVAAALAARSAGRPFDRKSFLETLGRFTATEEFQWQIGHALRLKPFRSLVSFGNSLEAHRSVMTAILCFADSPDSYEEAVTRAIAQGNDVDTLACMTGALSGARLGRDAVPQRLIDRLEDTEQGRDRLIEFARQLEAKSRSPRSS
ncbi:MAG: ADP-ribosylglycohydrolase family protein [Planctomycetota bacterium]